MTKDTGGPAFPINRPNEEWRNTPRDGMTLWDYAVIHAPEAEVGALFDMTEKGVASLLGISIDEYRKDPEHNFFRAVMKARGMWADAMIAERRSHD